MFAATEPSPTDAAERSRPYIGRSGASAPQLLRDHLGGAADRAEAMGQRLGLGNRARATALLHDLGKYHQRNQDHLRPGGEFLRAEHAGHGAALAQEARAYDVAFAIAAHHGSLSSPCDLARLLTRASHNDGTVELLAEARALRAIAIREIPEIGRPIAPWNAEGRDSLELDLEARLLTSLVVDADRLDAEAFASPEAAAVRAVPSVALAECLERVEDRIEQLSIEAAASGRAGEPVQQMRDALREHIDRAATLAPGFFALTVPTGGGKTLAGLRFALAHAVAHGHERVIFVIPTLSIIEQTAGLFRSILGPENVLEHHSGIHPSDGLDDARADLLTENWDAPIIVTTAVQFAESLFAAHPRRVRKLHRAVRAVVVVDETQALPSTLLSPLLIMLAGLARRFGLSILFMSATQPTLEDAPGLPLSAPLLPAGSVREIVPVDVLPTLPARVSVMWPAPDEALTVAEIGAAIGVGSMSTLAIVNAKRTARDLYRALRARGEPVVHLSAAMCAAHRSRVLSAIRRDIAAGTRIIVVSTQVVEAGVDLDFPRVFREEAPLSSITQAAGRCNREGALDGLGQMRVFRLAEARMPGGAYQAATELTRLLTASGAVDLGDPGLSSRYFAMLARKSELDPHAITEHRRRLDFRAVEAAFHMIEDETIGVLVAYDARAEELINRLKSGRLTRRLSRALQPYLVAVRPTALRRAEAEGRVTFDTGCEVYVASPATYDADEGLVLS